MPSYRGKPACQCLADWLPVFEERIRRQPRLFQLSGNAKASAGFHRDGGSADYEPLTWAELRIARNMGAAAWNRMWPGNLHSHLRLNGCPDNSIAQPQVADLNAGRDGTGPLYDNAGQPDDGPRDGVHWPLRTYRQGIEWARAQQEDDMPNIDEIVRGVWLAKHGALGNKNVMDWLRDDLPARVWLVRHAALGGRTAFESLATTEAKVDAVIEAVGQLDGVDPEQIREAVREAVESISVTVKAADR